MPLDKQGLLGVLGIFKIIPLILRRLVRAVSKDEPTTSAIKVYLKPFVKGFRRDPFFYVGIKFTSGYSYFYLYFLIYLQL